MGTTISAQADDDLRERFDRFKDDRGLNQSQATRQLVDEGLRAYGYHPTDTASALRSAFQATGAVLVLFALGVYGFASFAPVQVIAWANPFAFLMLVAGGGFLFIATVMQAAAERRLPGINYVRRAGG